jgi:hypothetical protein
LRSQGIRQAIHNLFRNSHSRGRSQTVSDQPQEQGEIAPKLNSQRDRATTRVYERIHAAAGRAALKAKGDRAAPSLLLLQAASLAQSSHGLRGMDWSEWARTNEE